MPLVLDPDVAPTDLHGRLASLRRKLRLISAGAGVFQLLALILAALTIITQLDRGLDLPAPLRAVALVAGLVGMLVLVHRWIVLPWRAAADEVGLARRVDRQVAGLHDTLASAIAFGADGSSELRSATTHFAVRRTRSVDFTELADARPLSRGFILCLFAGVIALLFGPGQVAVARLLDPYGYHPWPTLTQLEVAAVDTMARGEPFTLQINLAGVVPDRLSLGVWLDEAAPLEIPYAVDAPTLRLQVEPARVPRTFQYRVMAGDANTGWRRVAVTVPPQLAPLDGRPSPRWHVVPPAYCGLPAIDLPDGAGAVEVLLGTVVHVRAVTDRPIASAALAIRLRDERFIAGLAALTCSDISASASIGIAPTIAATALPLPLTLSGEAQSFAGSFIPLVSGAYDLEFTDDHGLTGRRAVDIRVLPDPAPTVALEKPLMGGDGLLLLPTASFDLSALVDDPQFAVRQVAIEYRLKPDEPMRRLPLYDGDILRVALTRMLTALPISAPAPQPKHLTIERRLSVTSLRRTDGQPPAVGDVITFAAIAYDFDDVSPAKPPGRSAEVQIRIVSKDRLEAQLAKARGDIAKGLAELLTMQSAARDLAAQAERQRRSAGELRAEDRDKLARAESLQQQIRDRLGDEHDGLRAAADHLEQTLKDNPGLPPSERTRAERLASELDRLAKDTLEPVVPLLSAARAEAGAIPPEERITGPLPDAIRRQKNAEDTLRSLVDKAQSGQALAALAAEAASLAVEQEQISQQRADAAKKVTAGVEPENLTLAEQRELKQLQERQQQLAKHAEEFARQLDTQTENTARAAEAERKKARQLEDDADGERNPAKSGEFRRASDRAADRADALKVEAEALATARNATRGESGTLPEQMTKASESIANNRLGEAELRQDAAAKQLDAIRSALHDLDRLPEGERLVKERKRSENQVNQLVREQEQLQDRTLAAEKTADLLSKKREMEELARAQEQLAQRTEETARQLRREGQDASARELERAARDMNEARQQLERGQPAAADQDDALEKLDAAADQAIKDRREAEEHLQREQLVKLSDRLKGLRDRQANHTAESDRLFQAAGAATNWSRSLQKSLADLGRDQDALGKELTGLGEKNLSTYKVLRRLADDAASAMTEVSAAIEDARDEGMSIDRLDVDRTAVRTPQLLATKRLGQLLEVLKPAEDEPNGGAAAGGKSGSGSSNQPGGDTPAPSDPVPPLAQLKLMRELQAELLESTTAFAQKHPDATKLTDAQRAQLDKLRKTQADLAELFNEITAEVSGGKP